MQIRSSFNCENKISTNLIIFQFQLLTTADEVAVLQIELENMQPELEAATVEAIETVVQITEDTVGSFYLFIY